MNSTKWKRFSWALAIVILAGGLTCYWILQAKTVSLPIHARIEVDNTPLGETAFNADSFDADMTIGLVPGSYVINTKSGAWKISVPADATVRGHFAIQIDDRGEGEGEGEGVGEGVGRRWVRVQADKSELKFDPAVKVTDPHGLAAQVSELSVKGTNVAATGNPLVAQSLCAAVMTQIWSAPPSHQGERPVSMIRDVKVEAGVVRLREGGKFAWPSGQGKSSLLAVQKGSEVKVHDLVVTERGSTVSGQLSVFLVLGSDSQASAGNSAIRLGNGELRAELDFRRTAENAHVKLRLDKPSYLTFNQVQVGPTTEPGVFEAEKLQLSFDALTWDQGRDARVAIDYLGRAKLTGITGPGWKNSFGLRINELGGIISGDAKAIAMSSIVIRVPKESLLAAVTAALPKAVPLEDHLVAENVLDLFRQVRLADLQIEPGVQKFDFVGDQITFSCLPVVNGKLKALGRHNVVTTKPPYYEVTWVNRADLPFTVPLTLNGRAKLKFVPGKTLADTKIEVITACDPVVVGEPTIKGLTEPLKSLVQLAALFRNQIRVKGMPLPEYLQKMASREEHLPLFGHNPPPDMAAFLRKITIHSFTFAPSGEEIIFKAGITLEL